MRIGINGFGRIGRVLTRVLWQSGRHEVVHINDINPDVANHGYLLSFDSTYGRLAASVRSHARHLTVHDSRCAWDVAVTSAAQIDVVDWSARDVDVVIEATGADANASAAVDVIQGSVRHVLLTRYWPHATSQYVAGVTSPSSRIGPGVVSLSTCDATAIAPVLAAVHEEGGIQHASLTTLHPWLSYQNLLDGVVPRQSHPGQFYGDYALGRASPGSVIPKSTTTAATVCAAIPALGGRVEATSFRIPVSVGCYADISVHLERPTSREALCARLATLEPLIRVSHDPLVSVDLLAEEASAIVDARWLSVHDARYARLVLGYDNEWGYSCRIRDLIDSLAQDALPASPSAANAHGPSMVGP